MKVAAIVLAIAVAGVSAHKTPAQEPLHFEGEQPAVRANLGKAAQLTGEGIEYGLHGAADVARHVKGDVLDPAADVTIGTTSGVAHSTAGYANRKVGDTFGATSAIMKKLAQASEATTNWLYGSAAANSRRYDNWHGASDEQKAAAHDSYEQAATPLRNGAENVKSAASDAKEKVVDLKNDAAAKLQASKDEAALRAEQAKEKTADAAHASHHGIRGAINRVTSKIAGAAERAGEVTKEAGEKVEDKAGALRERKEAKADEQLDHAKLVLEERSGASTLTMSGAAIAVASAAAVYLI